jgi:hypothetical protein
VFILATAWALPCHAQVAGVWVSASGMLAVPAADTINQVSVVPFRLEQLETTSAYTLTRAPGIDIGAGVRFTHIAVGLSFSRISTQKPATIILSVPNPIVANRPASASATTQTALAHAESSLHVELGYIDDRPRRTIAILAGPSFFLTTQDVVGGVSYDEAFNPATFVNVATITQSQTQTTHAHAWGYHIDVDAGYYFTPVVGIGALVRFSRATAQLPNVLSTTQNNQASTTATTAGGFSVGGGLRLRF